MLSITIIEITISIITINIITIIVIVIVIVVTNTIIDSDSIALAMVVAFKLAQLADHSIQLHHELLSR